jgi:hypothetical protein
VEADNQFVAEMTDEDLDNHLLPDLVGGHFELVPVQEGEEVPAGELVELQEIKPGVWFDAKNTEVYQRTNLTDPKTGNFLKTVRRNKKGPPKGLTYNATSISVKQAKDLIGGKEDDSQGRA